MAFEPVPAAPVVNAGMLYVIGMQLSWTSTTVLSVAAGQARDSTDTTDIALSAAATITASVKGVGGIDAGSVAASSMYAVYVVASSLSVVSSQSSLGGGFLSPPVPSVQYPVGVMISLASNASGPFLPTGYDSFRRVGWVSTDGSANFLRFWQYGSDQTREYYLDAAVLVVAAAGAGPSAVPLAVGVAGSSGIPAVPPIASQVKLDVVLSGAGTARFFPFGSSSAAGIVRFSAGAAAQPGTVDVPEQLNAGVPTVQVAVSAGTVQLSVIGYADYL